MTIRWHRSIVTGLAFSGVLCSTSGVFAQAAAVQQPVVGTFGTATTVSVPDRGTMRLGGVNTAASGRVSPGMFRPGTNSGIERGASSATVSVFIHDLQAMDEALLNQGAAFDQLDENGFSMRLRARRAPSETRSRLETAAEVTNKAARYEHLAREAEASRKLSLARLHWQVAAKHGSTVALQRLAALAR